VALESAHISLPAALEAASTRGRLRLDDVEAIGAAALDSHPVLRGALRKTKDGGGRLHLFGLVSDGGVHSSLAHLFALIDAAKRVGVRVVVHAMLDGVDVPSGSAPGYMRQLETKLDGGVGRIGTVCGRTWGMAPEGRWDRIEKVYRAVMADNVDRVDSALRGIEHACLFGVPEQFVKPFVVFDYPGVSLVDSALHFNFSADGAGELTHALTAPRFNRFVRQGGRAPFAGRFTCMTPFDAALGLPTLFPRAPDPSELPLDVLRAAGHHALSYDSGAAADIATATIEALRGGESAFILADLASPANPARSRSEGAAAALEQIATATRAAGGTVLVLGSRDASDSVPLAYVSDAGPSVRIREDARTSELAATLLDLLDVPPPSDMETPSFLLREATR
jgi:bisphosphoglycerate-independent phosphoglycerate mutase (AlkP superfamily)